MSENPSKLKLAIFWFGLLSLAGLLLLGGIEVLLRIALKRTLTAETGFPLVSSDVPGLKYQLAPNHRADGIETDSNGFRVRPNSARARYNILVVGDSVSFGSGVPYEKSYVPLLETRLNRTLGDSVAVWNAAVPGYNTSQEAAMLDRAAPVVHPDLVVLQFCMNDYLDAPTLTPGGNLDQSSSIVEGGSHFTPLAFLYRSVALVFLKEKFKDLQRARPDWFPVWAHYIHYIQRKPGWERAKEALVRVQKSATNMHAGLVVIVFPVEQQLRIPDRAAQDDLIQFMHLHGINSLDLYPSFQAHWREGLYINFWAQVKQFDKLHPNERGHALASEEIADYLVASKAQFLNDKASLISKR